MGVLWGNGCQNKRSNEIFPRSQGSLSGDFSLSPPKPALRVEMTIFLKKHAHIFILHPMLNGKHEIVAGIPAILIH